jgi:hypothetical protein
MNLTPQKFKRGSTPILTPLLSSSPMMDASSLFSIRSRVVRQKETPGREGDLGFFISPGVLSTSTPWRRPPAQITMEKAHEALENGTGRLADPSSTLFRLPRL